LIRKRPVFAGRFFLALRAELSAGAVDRLYPAFRLMASLLSMDRTTLTAALKPLGRRGLVKVTADPEDRRGRRMLLTERGKALLGSAVAAWKRTHASLQKNTGDGEPDRLRKLLRALS